MQCEIGDAPNAVHFTTTGDQSWRKLSSSPPLRGRCCLVRRLANCGLDRPLGLVSVPDAVASSNFCHHFGNCSGGKGAAGGEFATHEGKRMFEAQSIGWFPLYQRCLQHQFAHDMMCQQQAPELLAHQFRRLAAQDDIRSLERGLHFRKSGFDRPA